MTPKPSEDRGPDANPAPSTKRPLLVVLDTNVFVSNNLLQTVAGSTLVDLVIRARGRILLPEVIELELRNVLGEKLAKDAEKAAGLARGLEAIIHRDDLFKAPDVDELRAAIDQRLSELNPLIERAPFTLDIAQAALMRVIEGRPQAAAITSSFATAVFGSIVFAKVNIMISTW